MSTMLKLKIGVVIVAMTAVTGAVAGPFRNITNDRFRSRCNGPQGAIVITDNGTMRPSGVGATSEVAQAAATQHSAMQLQQAVRTLSWMQAHRLRSSRATLQFPRAAVHTDAAGQLVLPDLVKAQQTGTSIGALTNDITFSYSGWASNEQALLASYLATAYPKAKSVYGPPAFNISVKIIKDTSIQAIQGGIYDVTTNEIHMAPLSGNTAEDTFILLFLVLQAFHDDAILFYDAWEQGMAGAAATTIQASPGISPSFSPIDPGPFYSLSVYEAENQPELGNSTFFPTSGFTGMLVWRIAMARAAWLKCWIEDNDFFRKFNTQYYASYDSTLAGDVPRLTDIAEQALPTVEDTPFKIWFQQQYALDTSVTIGPKLFTWNIPLNQSVALIAEHYFTDTSGDESPRGGTARTDYLNYDYTISLYAEEGNVMQIPATGDGAGEGYLIPTFFNVGGAQRITVQLDLNDLQRRYIYPYGERGFESTDANFYGAIIGNDTGGIGATGGSSSITNGTVSRGVWGGRVSAGSMEPAKIQVTYTASDGHTATRFVNVGWDSYVVFLDGGAQSSVHFQLAKGTTGLYMISLPVKPLNTNAATVLGISPDDLLLARWDPSLATGQGYRLWPLCDTFAPGRGFWVRLVNDVQSDITGVFPPTSSDFAVPLSLGWNQIGSPRTTSVPITDLKVAVGSQTAVSLADAITNRIVQKGIFGYTQAEGYTTADALQPMAGYWIRCLSAQGARLIFPATTTTSARVRKSSAVQTQDDTCTWKMPLRVSAGGLMSTAAYIGAAAKATTGADANYDITAPPSFGPYVAVRFPHTDWGQQAGDYLTDVRPASDARQSWEMRVESTLTDAPVSLSWPDLSSLPRDLRPILVDEATGRRTYMRTTPSIVIPAATGQSISRRFRIEMQSATATTGPQVMSVMSSRTGAGMSIAYTLSAEAQVSARVLNIAGRPIRSLVTDRAQPAGQTVMLWNLRSDQNAIVPSGMYLLEMTVATPEGQSSRVVRSLNVAR